jgi:hypothetical protein
MAVRKGQLLSSWTATVLEAPPEQSELNVLLLIQTLEGSDTVSRRVAGDK